MRLPAAALLVAELLADGDAQKPVVVAYKRDYETRYKSDVSTFGGHAYDGLMIAVDAIKRAGSTDKAKVRDAIEATRGYVGTGGVVNMSAADHMGLDLTAFRMLEVRKGNWTGRVADRSASGAAAGNERAGPAVRCHRAHGGRRSTRWSRSASRSFSTRATSSTSRRASSS